MNTLNKCGIGLNLPRLQGIGRLVEGLLPKGSRSF
jgi:hypothetical protein